MEMRIETAAFLQDFYTRIKMAYFFHAENVWRQKYATKVSAFPKDQESMQGYFLFYFPFDHRVRAHEAFSQNILVEISSAVNYIRNGRAERLFRIMHAKKLW